MIIPLLVVPAQSILVVYIFDKWKPVRDQNITCGLFGIFKNLKALLWRAV